MLLPTGPVPFDPCGCHSSPCTPSWDSSLIFLGPLSPHPRASQLLLLPGDRAPSQHPWVDRSPLPPCSLANQYSSFLASQPTREGRSLPHPAQGRRESPRSLLCGRLGEGLRPEVPCPTPPPPSLCSLRDQPPGAHHRGGSPGWQGGHLPGAGPPLYPLSPVTAQLRGSWGSHRPQPQPPAPSMLC